MIFITNDLTYHFFCRSARAAQSTSAFSLSHFADKRQSSRPSFRCVCTKRCKAPPFGPAFPVTNAQKRRRAFPHRRRCMLKDQFPLHRPQAAQAAGVAAQPPRAVSRSSAGRRLPTAYMASSIGSVVLYFVNRS